MSSYNSSTTIGINICKLDGCDKETLPVGLGCNYSYCEEHMCKNGGGLFACYELAFKDNGIYTDFCWKHIVMPKKTFPMHSPIDRCIYPKCSNVKYIKNGKLSYYCTKHICKNVRCVLPKLPKKRFCITHIDSKNKDILTFRLCPVNNCMSLISNLNIYCSVHRCTIEGCEHSKTSNSHYCKHHKCWNPTCNKLVVKENSCYDHICHYEGCTEMVIGTLSDGMCYKHMSKEFNIEDHKGKKLVLKI
jgi:hypothetical protein